MSAGSPLEKSHAGNLTRLDSARRAINRIDVANILCSIGEVAYHWDLKSDALAWGDNVADVLQIDPEHSIATGREYAILGDPNNAQTRYDAVFDTEPGYHGDGKPYQVQYRIRPKGRRHDDQTLWIEDTGCWFADGNGKPDHAHGVVRVINERHAREERLTFLSEHDGLTGEFNRARLSQDLSDALDDAIDKQSSCAFYIVAIDNLRIINEAYGFAIADEVIASVTARLKGTLRGGDAIGRMSGNKMGLVLRDCSEEEHKVAAKRFLNVIRDEVIKTSAGPVSVTISVGAVVLPRYARTTQDALLRSQEMLERAKRHHRGAFVTFRPNRDMEMRRRANIKLSDQIIAAFNDHRLALAYQPIIDAVSGETVLHECLLRMIREDGEVVAAGAFIPLAEKLGFTRLLDARVLDLVMADLAAMPDAQLTFNLSGDSASDPHWLCEFAGRLIANREVAPRLVVEITETSAIENIEETQRFVATLKDLGCRVAIDDFGAGYTSFKNLKHLEVDLVKIDGSFIRDLARCPEDQVFVRTLAELAQTFDRRTIAEWVADEETADLLRSWGVDYFQGNIYGAAALDKPFPVAEAAE